MVCRRKERNQWNARRKADSKFEIGGYAALRVRGMRVTKKICLCSIDVASYNFYESSMSHPGWGPVRWDRCERYRQIKVGKEVSIV